MNQSRTIRLPVHIVKRLNGFLRAQRDYARETGHEAGSREIAESIGCSRLDVERLMILNEGISSVDAPAAADSKTAVVDMLSAESKQNPRNHVQTSEMRSRVECWLQQLSEKQREIICRRFGLGALTPTHWRTWVSKWVSHGKGLDKFRLRRCSSLRY